MLLQSMRMALKSISGNKMRSVLTMLGVVIGVVAIVVLVAIAQGANRAVVSRIEGLGTNLLSVTVRARRGGNALSWEMLDELRSDSSVAEVAPLNRGSGTAKAGLNTYEDGSVLGTSPSYASIRNYTVAQGRFLKYPDLDNRVFVAVLGQEAAKALFTDAEAVGKPFTLDGFSFTVVGVLEPIGSSMAGSEDNQILLPFTVMERIFSQKGVSSFYVSAVSAQRVGEAEEALNSFLGKLFPASDEGSRSTGTQYSVYNQTEMLSTLNETMATMSLMLGGIAGISLLVGGIGIMNIMLVSVTERTREIGIRKAIGAARGSILFQFVVEALFLSLLGGLIGLSLSVLACRLLAPILNMPLVVSPMVAAIAIGFSMFVGLVFGFYPANKASRLRPIDALRYEG